MRPFGFNVIGHISANAGLGVVARNTIALIRRHGHQVATFDIDPGRGRGRHDTTYDQLAVRSVEDLSYGISLVILSITALPDLLLDGRLPLRHDVINAGYFWWELPALTDVWIRSLQQFDVLVAGSEFQHGTFERLVSGTPSIRAWNVVEDVEAPHADRARFGIPAGRTVFIGIVEPTSDVIRKNPYATIEAFEKAFASDDPAHLVIKLNNVQAARGDGALARLRDALARLGSRATLIEATLPRREVIDLFSSCDIFVGLHRSEGLGLGLMEAMALGKPVIATGWSGNMSFMNQANSCLVGYRLVPVAGSVAAYTPQFLKQDAHWAEPNLDEAIAWMRALASNPKLRETIGARAAADIRSYSIEAERATFLDELHAIWEHEAIMPARRRNARDEALAELRKAQFEAQATPMQKVRRKSWGLVDRHLLWRFRSR